MERKIKRIIAAVLITTFVAGAFNFPVSAEELFGVGKVKKQDMINPGIKDCADDKVLQDSNDLKVIYNNEPEKPEPHPEPVFDDSEGIGKYVGRLNPKEKSEVIVKYKEVSDEEDIKDKVKDKDKIRDEVKERLKIDLSCQNLKPRKN